MRSGFVSIVPLLIAVMFIFWFMIFMGYENTNLSHINQMQNIQNTEDRLLYAALKYKYKLLREQPELSESEVDDQVEEYIKTIMQKNGL